MRMQNVWLKLAYKLNVEIRGRVRRAPATETVDSGSIPGRVKPKIIKLVFTAPCLPISIKKDSVKPIPCVVDRWACGS